MAACWPATLASCCDVLNGGDHLTLLDVVTLLDVEVGDAAHGSGAEVDVGLGLDLAGAADDRGEVLAMNLGGEDLGITRLLLYDEDGNKDDGHNNGEK